MSIHVFHRTFWKINPSWPDGREPGFGEKHTIATVDTEDCARALAKDWNESHDEGAEADRAEWMEE